MSRNHVQLHRGRWQAVRRAVFERDGWRCVECGRAGRLECDHVTPLQSQPGQDPYDINGLQTLCGGPDGCHAKKTRRENGRVLSPAEVEWRDYLRRLLPPV